jgi:co-chaperonin GroES (HSP10)
MRHCRFLSLLYLISQSRQLFPLFDRILIRRVLPQVKTASGLLLPEAAQTKLNEVRERHRQRALTEAKQIRRCCIAVDERRGSRAHSSRRAHGDESRALVPHSSRFLASL